MPNGWPYALGTLLCWAGIVQGISAIYTFVRVVVRPRGSDPLALRKQAIIRAATAAVLFLASGPLLRGHQHTTLVLPLFWLIMPFAAWTALAAAVFAVIRVCQLPFSDARQQGQLARQAVFGAAVCAVMAYLYRIDPSNSISLLNGGVPLTLADLAALILLAIAATLGMGLMTAYAQFKSWPKMIAAQLALVVGSVVFGIPFLWLVITSFKEDVDMASANGLVWIPKVTETVPFMDAKSPLLQGTFEGQTVQAEIIQRNNDGTVLVNILKPGGVAGRSYAAPLSSFKEIPKDAPLVWATFQGQKVKALVADDLPDGTERLHILEPSSLKDQEFKALPADVTKIRHPGLNIGNYPEALDFLPPEADHGLVYLSNTLYLVALSLVGTLLSSSIVAYAFSRMRFPGSNFLFGLMLSTMMLPAAVTMLPQFLIFRSLGWIDTLRPLWVPAFLGSAFNIFLLRQFLMNIPMELEDAAKIDGCSYLKTFWAVMLPQIKPALAVIGIWTFMGAWNNFMGPLIYVTSPEHMPISYALQQYNSDRGGEPGLLMAFTTMSMLPVLALFFFAQRYFIEGVTLSGLGGR